MSNEINEIAPNVEVRIVQADFYDNSNLDFYNDIMSKVEDLDIGLIVLNAGIMSTGAVEEIKGEKI